MLRLMYVRFGTRALVVSLAAAGLAACSGGDGAATARPSDTAPTSSAPSPASAASTRPVQTVTLFLSDGEGCQANTEVQREVAASGDKPETALGALLSGPTQAERRRGLDFFGSPEPKLLRSLRLRGHVAYVDLTDAFLRVNNVSTACGGAVFRSGVEKTLRHAAAVQNVVFAVESSPAAFYEHMQLACPSPGGQADGCDPAPFHQG